MEVAQSHPLIVSVSFLSPRDCHPSPGPSAAAHTGTSGAWNSGKRTVAALVDEQAGFWQKLKVLQKA